MVTDFSAAEKAMGVKFRTLVGLLSRQVFSPLVKIGSRGVTGAALLCGMYAATDATLRGRMDGGSVRHWELRAAALLKAIWWDFCLADGLVL